MEREEEIQRVKKQRNQDRKEGRGKKKERMEGGKDKERKKEGKRN